MCKLLILGGGQHGQVVREIAELSGNYDKIDFLDDNLSDAVGKISDYNVIGLDYDYLFVAIGNNELRLELINKINAAGLKLAVLIHPSAVISKSAILKEGVLIGANAIVNANSLISEGVIVSVGAIVDHNSIVLECCHIRPGAVVSPNKRVCKLTEVGFNSVY